MNKKTVLALFALSLLPAAFAYGQGSFPPGQSASQDGIYQIDQKRIQMSGGFPYRITRPGHYRLTGSLAVTDPAKSGIQIEAEFVTIDLNGYTIQGTQGPGLCIQAELCGSGILDLTGHDGLVVMNGAVRGFWNAGIESPGSKLRIEKVIVAGNGGNGIGVGRGSTVSGCTVTDNGWYGIWAYDRSIVTGNVVSENANDGIHLGVMQGDGSLVTDNVVTTNGGYGIVGDSDNWGGYARNVVTRNKFGLQIKGGVPMGGNACGTSPCP